MHCPLRCETVIKARQKFHTVVFDGSETTVLPLRFRLRAAGAVTMLFSTPWPLWSPVLWLCNVFFFSAAVAFVAPSGFCVCSGGGITPCRCKTCGSVPNSETVKDFVFLSTLS